MIGFGQVINGLDYTLTTKDVQSSNCVMPLQIFSTPMTEGVAFYGEFLWYSSSNLITKIDLLNNVINSFSIPYSNGGLCFDGINLWKVAEQNAQLYRLDINGLILDTFLLPSSGNLDPNGWGIAWDGNYIWHSEYAIPNSSSPNGMSDSTKFYKIDPFNGQILNSFILPYGILGIEFVNGNLHGIRRDFPGNPNPPLPYHQKYIIDINTESYIDSVEWCIEYPLGLTFTGIDFWSASHAGTSPGLYEFPLSSSTNIKEIDKYKRNLLKVTDLLGRETKETNQPLFYIYDNGTVEKRIVIE